jgi:hypothetical protein
MAEISIPKQRFSAWKRGCYPQPTVIVSLDIIVLMKAVSHPAKAKNEGTNRPTRSRPAQGQLFLGYKALHELRILMRIASSPSAAQGAEETPDKASF